MSVRITTSDGIWIFGRRFMANGEIRRIAQSGAFARNKLWPDLSPADRVTLDKILDSFANRTNEWLEGAEREE